VRRYLWAGTYTVRLHAPADGSLVGDFRVSLDVADRPAAEKFVQLKLTAAPHQDVPLRWTPKTDGWYRLTFRVIPTDSTTPSAQIEQHVPVTHRPLVFLWFGAPQHFQWCNVPTTVKAQDRVHGQRRAGRGSMPTSCAGSTTATLPGLPGDTGGVVTRTPKSLPPGQPAAFELNSRTTKDTVNLEAMRSGDVLKAPACLPRHVTLL
jgi:hypothetical protein